MQFSTVLVFSSFLVLQTCFAQNPIQDYIVKNELKDRISHDERVQERLQDRKAHDYRVLNQIAYDTAYRGGHAYGDAALTANLQNRIASDSQAQALLSDRIGYDKRLLTGVQKDAYAAYPYYNQYYQQGYYPQYYQHAVPSVHPVVPPPPPAPIAKVPVPIVHPVHPAPVVHAAPSVQVPIISYENDINPDGSYRYSYSTGNGIAAQEEGAVRVDARGLEPANVAQGSFAYTSPEGVPVSVSYTADENGFHARTSYSHNPAPVEKFRVYNPAPVVPVPIAAGVPSHSLDINPKLGRPLFSEPHTP